MNFNFDPMIHWSDKILNEPQPRSCYQHGADFVYADYLIRYTEKISVRRKIITFYLTKPVCIDCLDFQTALMAANHGQIEVIRIKYDAMTPRQREVFNCRVKHYQRAV